MNLPKLGILAMVLGASVIALANGPAHFQATQGETSSESTERDFDFLIGSWEFTAESKVPGTPPVYHGHWTGERTGDATLVEDDFTGLDDNGRRVYLGVTIRAFDAKAKRWTTAFVEPVRYLEGPKAKWSLGTAWREGHEMREGPLDESKASRARFYDIAPDHFSWKMDRSTDGGKTWISDFLRVQARRASVGQH
jgi:hypothetical protein